MSTPHHDIIISVIVEMRRFQVLVIQEGPDRWRGTISERTGGPYKTRELGSVETNDGQEAVLHLAFGYILRVAGLTGTEEPAPDEPAARPAAPVPTPWRLLR